MKKLTSDIFFKRCVIKHKSKYSYDNSVYKGLQSFIEVECSIHGTFRILAQNHLYKGGCPQCARDITGKKNSKKYSKDKKWFLEKAFLMHGNRYTYKKTKYKNQHTHVIITCSIHGDFNQLAQSHLRGSGCPRCATAGRSRGQDDWLDFLKVPSDNVHRNVRVYFPDGSWLRADAFMNNTFYEYWGDWAHGNPKFYQSNHINKKFKKTFGELYQQTIDKIQKIQSNGFKLIQIWEHEWFDIKRNMPQQS